MVQYTAYLSFYLLMKVKSKPIDDHAVLYKLTSIKTLLDQLAVVDSRLNMKAIQKSSGIPAETRDSSEEDEQMSGDSQEDQSGSDESENMESEVSELDEDIPMTQAELKMEQKFQKKLIKSQIQQLDDDAAIEKALQAATKKQNKVEKVSEAEPEALVSKRVKFQNLKSV